MRQPPPTSTGAKTLLLDEWLGDFPFTEAASQAHAVAAALTPIVRELIVGPTPLFAIDAPAPGTGKGLRAETIGLVALGAPPPVMADVRDQDELRKRVTSLLLEGSPVILLDNVNHRLASGTLAAALTAVQWSDRRLGSNETVRAPNRALWMVTGNNLDLSNEIARRTVWVRIDPRVDRPWERSGFRHDPLTAWVRDHRHNLLWSLLVLARHWVATARPAWNGSPLGVLRVLGSRGGRHPGSGRDPGLPGQSRGTVPPGRRRVRGMAGVRRRLVGRARRSRCPGS